MTNTPPAAADPTSALQLLEMSNLLRPMAIRVAASLGLADELQHQPLSSEDLAARTECSLPHLVKLMSYLSELEVFTETPEGLYQNTALSEPLLTDSPFSLRRALDVGSGIGRSQLALIGLMHTIKTGETSHESVFGSKYWDDLNDDPRFLETLRAEGNRDTVFGAEELINGYDWSQTSSVIDIGGNNGIVLISLLKAFPHLTGATLDLANFSTIATEELTAAGLTDRAEAIEGNFFSELPTGYDVYLLSAILNDWNDSETVEILRNVARAAGPSGRVVLGEVHLRYETMSANVAEIDLYMSTLVPSPIRTPDQIEKLANRAGLSLSFVRAEHPLRTVIELVPTVTSSVSAVL